jgi:hypothetical protein
MSAVSLDPRPLFCVFVSRSVWEAWFAGWSNWNAGPRLIMPSLSGGLFALLSCMIAYPTAPISISRDMEPVSVGAISNGKLLGERNNVSVIKKVNHITILNTKRLYAYIIPLSFVHLDSVGALSCYKNNVTLPRMSESLDSKGISSRETHMFHIFYTIGKDCLVLSYLFYYILPSSCLEISKVRPNDLAHARHHQWSSFAASSDVSATVSGLPPSLI